MDRERAQRQVVRAQHLGGRRCPQAGWNGDLIDEILTYDVCAAYLDAHQFPSQSGWEHCHDMIF